MDIDERFDDDTPLKVIPFTFVKGSTIVAVYGMSYFTRHEISEKLKDKSKWPNIFEPVKAGKNKKVIKILVLHQIQSTKTFDQLILFEKFNLVIWGQAPDPKFSQGSNCLHLQPGSATLRSINTKEAIPKSMWNVSINTDSIKVIPIKYQRSRIVHLGRVL